MAKISQPILTFPPPPWARLALAATTVFSFPAAAQNLTEPTKVISVGKVATQRTNEFGEFITHTFCKYGERHTKDKVYPAMDVDSSGEVPDSAWYHNRHGRRRMNIAELVRGPGNTNAPSMEGPWTVVSAKLEGITPGLRIKDARGRSYLIKFDPYDFPELASAADVVGSKFFYALGYHVPENYIVKLERERLVIVKKGATGKGGKERPLAEKDIDRMLARVRKDSDGRYRALASLLLEGEPVGPYHYHGVRSDDPNDTIPHEHRRSLRGLYVMSAWLNHTDSKAGNSLDVIVTENGVRYIKHYLIDFGATLGSASFESKSARQGHEHLIDLKPSLVQTFSLGLYVPKWARVDYSKLPSVGKFEAEAFVPDRWKGNYPNPAFDNRLPEDSFWGAKQVVAFRDDEIQAIVETGQYRDPRAVDWIVRTLIARRDKIAKAFSEPGLRRNAGVGGRAGQSAGTSGTGPE